MKAKPNPVAELCSYLSGFATRCRAARWLGALFHVEVVQTIAADIATQQRAEARSAYTAEQEVLEAQKIIRQVTLDGFVTIAEKPRLASALRLLHSSARRDHALADLARN